MVPLTGRPFRSDLNLGPRLRLSCCSRYHSCRNIPKSNHLSAKLFWTLPPLWRIKADPRRLSFLSFISHLYTEHSRLSLSSIPSLHTSMHPPDPPTPPP